jgi:hypothetical protein
MTPQKDLAELAARALAQPSGTGRSPAQEVAAIAAVASAIRARRLRQRRRVWIGSGLAAAAALALALGLARQRAEPSASLQAPAPAATQGADMPPALATVEEVTGEAYVLHAGVSLSVARGRPVAAGDQVVVQHGGGVALGMPSGTRVVAEEGADVTVLAQGATQLFRLTAGSLSAKVHKLAQGERFVVRTADAEVEVRGTAFRVAVVAAGDASCGAGLTTRVSVDEGVVAVRSGATEVRVPAGHAWPECGAVAAMPEVRPAPAGAVAPRAPAAARSDLGEQNDLYANAIAARDRGDWATAVARFERLATQYPAAPLAENALAERMKILAVSSPALAPGAAREYLAKYPSGAARADAKALLARPGSP